MPTKTLHNDVALFAPIDLAKVSQEPDGTLLVPAVFSTERVDDQGERVTYEALQKAAPDYMQWAAVNEMHQLSAVGTTVELNLDDQLRKASGTLHIVDPIAVQKVLTGVYRGTSIEGRKLHRSLSKAAGAKWDVDDIQWNRISLADRPSNPDAVLLLAKAAGAEEETAMDEETTTDVAEPEGSQTATEAGPALAKATDAEAPDSDFADPEKRTGGPIKVPNDVHLVAQGIGRFKGDHDAIKKRLIAIAKRKGPAFVAQLPQAWRDEMAHGDTGGDMKKATDPGVADQLAKSAVDDAAGAGMALTIVNLLLQNEASEPTVEADQLASLRTAQTALLAFMGQEVAEVGTPADVAAVAAESCMCGHPFECACVGCSCTFHAAPAAPEMAYTASIGDLRKVAGRLQAVADTLAERLEKITPLEGTVTLEATAAPDLGALLKVALADDDTLAKVAQVVSERIGVVASKADLDAAKVELLAGFTPAKELLEKVAKMAAPGGPVRYANRNGRTVALDGGDETDDELDPASVLKKAAGMVETRDPGAAASLRQAAAEQMVQRIRNGG